MAASAIQVIGPVLEHGRTVAELAPSLAEVWRNLGGDNSRVIGDDRLAVPSYGQRGRAQGWPQRAGRQLIIRAPRVQTPVWIDESPGARCCPAPGPSRLVHPDVTRWV